MTNRFLTFAVLVIFRTSTALPQTETGREGSVPLYRVTVVDRTVRAVDYQYRNGPTTIGFRGTVLLPQAKGEAIVESKEGRVEVEARLERLLAPGRFGPEYLTYVLWAITPEGHAKNLGEVLAGHSDKAHLRVTTNLQAFGLVVTAEPYSAVRQPSDVVVLENEIRPDTIGRTEPITAKYELLPRGHYTYEVPSDFETAAVAGPKLSMNDYQQVVELYQAQNAMQIAEAAGAAQYAGDTYRKAAGLLRQAQEAHTRSAGMTRVVTLARQAAETAEDARVLAVQRKQQEELGQARERANAAEQSRARAEAAVVTAQTEAAASRALLEQEGTARRQTEATTAPAPPPPAQRPDAETRQPAAVGLQQKTELRMRLFREFSAAMPARDTPRGLLMTISGTDFQAGHPRASVYQRLAAVAETIGAHPGLAVTVEGHGPFSDERAFAVRDILAHDGVASSTIAALGLGDGRPLTSNATAAGREQNRRVEIIISGGPIGQLPNWAKAYRLMPNRP